MEFKSLCVYLCAITSNLRASSFASSNFCPETILSSLNEVSCSKEPIGTICLICPTNKSDNMWWYRNSKIIFHRGVLTGKGPFTRNFCHLTLESLEVSNITGVEDVYECATGHVKKTLRKFLLNIKVQTTLYIRKISPVSIGNDTINGSLPEIHLTCVLEGAYGNVSLAWYVDDLLKLRETFYERSDHKDYNVTHTLLLKHHNTSKTREVSCRSSGPFMKDAIVTLTMNPGSCTSNHCIESNPGAFRSSTGVIILIAVASVCVSIGCLLFLWFKRKGATPPERTTKLTDQPRNPHTFTSRACNTWSYSGLTERTDTNMVLANRLRSDQFKEEEQIQGSGHAGHLQINPRKSVNRMRETYRAASLFTPTTEMEYYNQNGSEQLDETNFEVSLEVQVKTTAAYEYWKGTLTTQGQNRRSCFIKTLAAKSTLEEAFAFKKLAEKLSKLQIHENIVDVLSISVMDVPYSIYFEFVECGNLREFIMTRYQHAGVSRVCEYSVVTKSSVVKRQTQELLSFTRDIAEGMSFLESQKFCHPGLCLRKVLLTGHVRCKLYDIHPLKMAMQRIKELMKKEHPPTAWLAPETIFMKEYTAASDAWNFAVVLWELFSLGDAPYAGMTKTLVERQIRQSKILSRPIRCPGAIFSLMLSCWKTSRAERPTFEVIRQQCADILRNINDVGESTNESGSPEDYTELEEGEEVTI